ncbi:hypothetical protein [Acidocella facilis]|uniref:hypothetical protein n=1 Tax=Acidocella facilis TaxID=525 RepID=UPI0005517D0D|nr:hypothetical protein [Acidocella facilis]
MNEDLGQNQSFWWGVFEQTLHRFCQLAPRLEEFAAEIHGILTTAANEGVTPIHPKAMPVILIAPDAWDVWLSAPWAMAKDLHGPAGYAKIHFKVVAGMDILPSLSTRGNQDGTL